MKLPQVIYLGYYHPSTANWSYEVYLIVDESGARLYTSTFGGEQRIKVKHERINAGKGSGVEYKWRDIKDLLDIESYAGTNWPRENESDEAGQYSSHMEASND